MLSAGMPELNTDQDIQYLADAMQLNLSDGEAAKEFKREIQRAMRTFSRRVDNFAHNYVH